MAKKYPYPTDLSPSRLALLAAHQEGRDMGNVGDLRSILGQISDGIRVIDCSPEAREALDLAMLKAADRQQGLLRFYPDELRSSAPV